MDEIELRELRYFIAVAEELNFTRAAARLGMAQPPLSAAIGKLERKLGVRLLERTSRRVTLTPAGAVLLEQGRIAVEGVGAAIQRARRKGTRTPRKPKAPKSTTSASSWTPSRSATPSPTCRSPSLASTARRTWSSCRSAT